MDATTPIFSTWDVVRLIQTITGADEPTALEIWIDYLEELKREAEAAKAGSA